MEDRNNIEMNIADAIIEKPVGFSINGQNFFIYPPTLGKTYLVARLLIGLNANSQSIVANLCLEALRLCESKKEDVCRILSYYTFNQKADVLDHAKVEKRTAFFCKNFNSEELSTLFILLLSNDKTEEFIRHLGIDKEREKKERIFKAKDNKGSLSFGGNSAYGTLIDFACQRYGWTMDYVVWGISYANLKMLMADAITVVYPTEEERKKLNLFSDREIINADDPKNRELVRRTISE